MPRRRRPPRVMGLATVPLWYPPRIVAPATVSPWWGLSNLVFRCFQPRSVAQLTAVKVGPWSANWANLIQSQILHSDHCCSHFEQWNRCSFIAFLLGSFISSGNHLCSISRGWKEDFKQTIWWVNKWGSDPKESSRSDRKIYSSEEHINTTTKKAKMGFKYHVEMNGTIKQPRLAKHRFPRDLHSYERKFSSR